MADHEEKSPQHVEDPDESSYVEECKFLEYQNHRYDTLTRIYSVKRHEVCYCREVDEWGYAPIDDRYHKCECDPYCDLYGIRIDVATTKNPRIPSETTYRVTVYKKTDFRWSFDDQWQGDMPIDGYNGHFTDKDRLGSFAVQKCDDAGWEPSSQKAAVELQTRLDWEHHHIDGFLTARVPGYKLESYYAGFENCLSWMATKPKNVETDPTCAHVAPKKGNGGKSRGRRK